MQGIVADLRYAFRILVKRPGFTTVALMTLALGIGANSAIFSVVNAVVLRPLPYDRSDQLLQLWSQFPSMNFFEFPVSPPEYLDMREHNEFFQEVGGWVTGGANLTGEGAPVRITVTYATASLFRTLRVEAFRGRTYTDEEDTPSAPPVIVLSHGLWQQNFAADPNIVGKDVRVDGQVTRVVGVMPAGFAFPDAEVQAWQPVGLDANAANWGSHFLRVVGRVEDGLNLESAQGRLLSLLQYWDEARKGQHAPKPPDGQHHSMKLVDLHEQIVGDVRPAMLVLLGAVGFVLLIACVNVANLLLARAEDRHREVAVRKALGVARSRLLRQFATESLLLSLIGGLIGMGVAGWGVRALLSVNPEAVPRLTEIGLDWEVLAYTLGLVLLTGLVFGLVPAFQLMRGDLNESLKDGGRGSSSGVSRQRFRSLLVAVETALAVVLLVGAGLMVRSFFAMQSIDAGFEGRNRLTLRTMLANEDFPENAQVIAFYRDLLDSAKALPGVQEAGLVSSLPLRSQLNANDFSIEGWVPDPAKPSVNVDYQQAASPGYFRAMGIPIKEGRDISETDNESGKPVVFVSESFVRRFWPGESGLGKRVRACCGDQRPWMEIVGVVGDVRQLGLREEFKPHMYVPMAQNPGSRGFAFQDMSLVLHVQSNPLSLGRSVRELVWSKNRNIPVAEVQTMEQIVGTSLAEPRFTVMLLGVFGATALLLAAVGIYGVMSYSVSRRTQEIGVRMALGARGGDVLNMVVRQGMILAVVGLVIGTGCAFFMTGWMRTLLYGVQARDALSFFGAAVILALVALASCLIPARRATRIDPIEALHYE